jgi:hypothetical protein
MDFFGFGADTLLDSTWQLDTCHLTLDNSIQVCGDVCQLHREHGAVWVLGGGHQLARRENALRQGFETPQLIETVEMMERN